MPELIKQGYVYLAQPPLYKIEKNKRVWYAYSDEELNNILKEIGRDQNKMCIRDRTYVEHAEAARKSEEDVHDIAKDSRDRSQNGTSLRQNHILPPGVFYGTGS